MKNSNLTSLRFWAVFICVFGLSAIAPVNAQDGTISHRRLELPQNSPTAPQQQLARLLQYFQSLKGEQPQAAKPDSQDSSAISELKKSLGPELGSMLDQLPPNTVNDAMKDPVIRNQVKDMLQQFSEDGTLPEFLKRPAEPKNGSAPAKPASKQAGDPNNNNNLKQPGQDRPQFPRTGANSSGSEPTPSDRQDAQDRLKDLIEKLRERKSDADAAGNPSDKGSAEPNPQRGNQDTSRPDDLQQDQLNTTDLQTPMTQSQWEERIRELIQKQRDSIRKPADKPATNQLQPNPSQNLRDTSPRNQGRSSQPESLSKRRPRANPDSQSRPTDPFRSPTDKSDTEQNRSPADRSDDSSRTDQAAPSFSEFLDQMQGAPTPDLSDLGIDLSAAQNNQSGPKGKMSGNLLADAMKRMDPQQLREQAKKALQDDGLRNTLKDILKDAKQSAKQEAASTTGPGDLIADVAAATGMEDTVLEALGGMSEELVEIAKDAKFQNGPPSQNPASQQSGSSATNQSSSNDKSEGSGSSKSSEEKSAFSQFTESATNALSNFSKTPETATGTAASSDMMPDLGGDNLPTLVIAVLLVAILIACLIIGKRLAPRTDTETSEQVLASLLKQGIRSREDVIQAFHQFALKPPHETQNWWTHSRVVETVVQQYPHHSARIQILASLYEQARYFPADEEFTDAQIQQAADAVRTVGVA